MWLIINNADNSLYGDGQVVTELPDPLPTDTHTVIPPLTYGFEMQWSPEQDGFIPINPVQPLMSVGRFKLLLTKAERLAIRAAAQSSVDVEDFLDLLNGFTEGVSLSDPVLINAINEMATAGLLTSIRAAEILAGVEPS